MSGFDQLLHVLITGTERNQNFSKHVLHFQCSSPAQYQLLFLKARQYFAAELLVAFWKGYRGMRGYLEWQRLEGTSGLITMSCLNEVFRNVCLCLWTLPELFSISFLRHSHPWWCYGGLCIFWIAPRPCGMQRPGHPNTNVSYRSNRSWSPDHSSL